MIRLEGDVTPSLLAVMEQTSDPRLREIMLSLIKHLHALIAKPGFKVLISQIYDPADPHIDSDVQFGVTEATTGCPSSEHSAATRGVKGSRRPPPVAHW